jgi:hypothetical protein
VHRMVTASSAVRSGAVFRCEVSCSLAANVDPVRDKAGVGACLDAELGFAQVAVLVQVAFVDADPEACTSGQKVTTPYCQLG